MWRRVRKGVLEPGDVEGAEGVLGEDQESVKGRKTRRAIRHVRWRARKGESEARCGCQSKSLGFCGWKRSLLTPELSPIPPAAEPTSDGDEPLDTALEPALAVGASPE